MSVFVVADGGPFIAPAARSSEVEDPVARRTITVGQKTEFLT